jgi:hypothetical protein
MAIILLLMAATGGLQSEFGLLAIVLVVAPGRFRGTVQTLIRTPTCSAIGIAATADGHPTPRGFMGPFSLRLHVRNATLCLYD